MDFLFVEETYIIANRKLSLDSGSNLVFLNPVKFSNNLRELVIDFSSSSNCSSSSWFIDFKVFTFFFHLFLVCISKII